MIIYKFIPALLICVACGEPAADTPAAPDAGSVACDEFVPEWGPGGALMLAGTDCLECHTGGGRAESTPFELAGSVFAGGECGSGAEGTSILIIDSNNDEFELQANAVGNFYSDEAMSFPLQVSIERGGIRKAMQMPVTTGACGSCHAPEQALGVLQIEL